MQATMMVCKWGNPDVRTTFGSIKFEKDVPRLVAPHMVTHCLERGITPVDEDAKLFEDSVSPEEPLDVGSRAAAIEKAVEAIIARNDPDEFTAGASPKVQAVAKEANLSKVSASEVKKVLDERNKKLEANAAALRKAKTESKAAVTEPPDDDEGRDAT
jgi:hypothetical protein